MGAIIPDSGLMQQAPRLIDALMPAPPRVVNQRHEPFFSEYALSGRTYRTASGVTVPNELQYYNGEMVHFYGECTNVAAVNQALIGSGYKPVTLKYADGRETAVAQVWASRFTDTTIGPYSAMFIVVMVVGLEVPAAATSMRADPNGASSVVPMLDGSFDPATRVYENRARLFLVRLLDTTQVAIDVGRERMGTDKRPGTLEMVCDGRQLRLSIKDQEGRGVTRADLELTTDSGVYRAEVARAAATAGIPLLALPGGTEYVYPAAARIGRGAVVSWQWRSDLIPRLQPVVPGTIRVDPASEEGRMLLTWGFTPKVLGYIPNVRGVITGLADPPAQMAPRTSTRRLGEAVTMSVPLCRAGSSGEPAVGEMPVLRLVAQALSHGLGAPVNIPSIAQSPDSGTGAQARPRWTWNTTFLGSLTATLRKEVVGPTPDGLRINWYVKTGSFVGPGFHATVLPGAADWMRIRRDGVGIVSVHACLEAGEDRIRVYGTYGGIVDLGPDGYARALRDEFDQLPPVVVTPTYSTADPRLEWLNRAQCVGIGRVDMATLRIEIDVYVLRVGPRNPEEHS